MNAFVSPAAELGLESRASATSLARASSRGAWKPPGVLASAHAIDPVLIATGNDWRAVEAGAHAYAARSGQYTSLSAWERDAQGNLVGTIEMPLAVGIVDGATKVHPAAQAALKLLHIKHANELSEICVCAGLASNLAAMRALATEGIQRGHMSLHARQIAMAAGAHGGEIDEIARRMVEEKLIKPTRAEALLLQLRGVSVQG